MLKINNKSGRRLLSPVDGACAQADDGTDVNEADHDPIITRLHLNNLIYCIMSSVVALCSAVSVRFNVSDAVVEQQNDSLQINFGTPKSSVSSTLFRFTF